MKNLRLNEIKEIASGGCSCKCVDNRFSPADDFYDNIIYVGFSPSETYCIELCKNEHDGFESCK